MQKALKATEDQEDGAGRGAGVLGIVLGAGRCANWALHSSFCPIAYLHACMLAYFSIVTGTLEIPDLRYRIVVEPLVVLSFGSALAILFSRLRKPAKVTNNA